MSGHPPHPDILLCFPNSSLNTVKGLNPGVTADRPGEGSPEKDCCR